MNKSRTKKRSNKRSNGSTFYKPTKEEKEKAKEFKEKWDKK